jgi:molybdenum cofactor cytidylyltransferase
VNSMLPVVIVLAAGHGSRFAGDRHKLEQSLAGGTVLGRTLAAALATQLRVVVVCNPTSAAMARGSVAARDTVVLPSTGPQGMGRSIAAGVSATASAPGWVIVPGDMPLIQPSSIRAVAARLSHDPVVYAQYRGQRGHPVGFSSELYSELIALQGDEGARRLLMRYAAQAVAVEDPGVLVDIDTESDLERVRAQLALSPAN